MIVDNIKNMSFYIKNFPYMKKAFEFLSCNAGLFPGSAITQIDDKIYATTEKSNPKPLNEQKLELHKKFIDLHYIISGSDTIGWKSAYNCKDVYSDFNEKKDIMFFNEKPDFQFELKEGFFVIFFPEDAHSPLSGKKPVNKCIIKINVELAK